jgi:hypothetical protein
MEPNPKFFQPPEFLIEIASVNCTMSIHRGIESIEDLKFAGNPLEIPQFSIQVAQNPAHFPPTSSTWSIYNGGSGTGTSSGSGGTTSGGDLWDSYSTGLGLEARRPAPPVA